MGALAGATFVATLAGICSTFVSRTTLTLAALTAFAALTAGSAWTGSTVFTAGSVAWQAAHARVGVGGVATIIPARVMVTAFPALISLRYTLATPLLAVR
jgi:hypothetical protein